MCWDEASRRETSLSGVIPTPPHHYDNIIFIVFCLQPGNSRRIPSSSEGQFEISNIVVVSVSLVRVDTVSRIVNRTGKKYEFGWEYLSISFLNIIVEVDY